MHTILLLEDDVSLNRGITLTLQKAGYLVLSAFTLSEAKKHLEMAKEKVSLIICDITLPDGSGLDFGKCGADCIKGKYFSAYLGQRRAVCG